MSKEKFAELLDQTYMWPDYYEFKFIVPVGEKASLQALLPDFIFVETPSKQGNYISLSCRRLVKSTQEIIDTYESVSTVKGIISL